MIAEAVEDPKFCLVERNGSFCLRCDHSYFYQVNVCSRQYITVCAPVIHV